MALIKSFFSLHTQLRRKTADPFTRLSIVEEHQVINVSYLIFDAFWPKIKETLRNLLSRVFQNSRVNGTFLAKSRQSRKCDSDVIDSSAAFTVCRKF